MRQAHGCSSKHREPPARGDEHLQEQHQRAKTHEIEKHFGLRVDRAIHKHAEGRPREQSDCVPGRKKSAEDQEEKKEQENREIDVEGLGAREELRFTQPGLVDPREQERKNRHAVPVLDDGVVALILVPRISQIRPLIAHAWRRGERTPARVRFEGVNGQNEKHHERDASLTETRFPERRDVLHGLVHNLPVSGRPERKLTNRSATETAIRAGSG
jgi:hypothetical protein